ncbi:MAG: twin-arginine translocation signal domain-containing protein, partial [Acidobacteriota bacterium]
MHRTSRSPNRRQFLCGCSAAVAALAGSRFNSLAFGMRGAQTDPLIVVFLRGGMDGLSLLPPITASDRGHY